MKISDSKIKLMWLNYTTDKDNFSLPALVNFNEKTSDYDVIPIFDPNVLTPENHYPVKVASFTVSSKDLEDKVTAHPIYPIPAGIRELIPSGRTLIAILPGERIITATFEKFSFTVKGLNVNLDIDNPLVSENGIKSDCFGVSFAGHSYTAQDAALTLVRAYINGDESIKWIDIPPALQKAKEAFFKPALTINNREIPLNVINSLDEVLTLKIATNGFNKEYRDAHPDYLKDYYGTLAYENDGDSVLLTDYQGQIITDMENFYISGLSQMYREDLCVYGKDALENIADYYEFDNDEPEK